MDFISSLELAAVHSEPAKPNVAFIEWYTSSMKEKTSITLSTDVLAGIDRLASSKRSRSAIIERVLRRYLSEHARALVQARDLKQLNHAADDLNREAADVLDYQILEG
jgi:predicted transcriptional regulator